MNGASGLVHISEFSEEKIESVREFVNESDEIQIKVIGKDGDKFRLSYKAVSDGEGIDPKYEASKPSRSKSSRKPSHRGDRRNNNRGNSSKNHNKHNETAFNDNNDQQPKKKKRFFWQ